MARYPTKSESSSDDNASSDEEARRKDSSSKDEASIFDEASSDEKARLATEEARLRAEEEASLATEEARLRSEEEARIVTEEHRLTARGEKEARLVQQAAFACFETYDDKTYFLPKKYDFVSHTAHTAFLFHPYIRTSRTFCCGSTTQSR
jgi:hypothetical protein